MRFAGIDIGSRTIELVVDEAGPIKARLQADTGFGPISEAKKMMDGVGFDRIMATGCGRNLFEIAFDAPTVTEIKSHAGKGKTIHIEYKNSAPTNPIEVQKMDGDTDVDGFVPSLTDKDLRTVFNGLTEGAGKGSS
jgi:hypothetical protein